MINQDLFFWWQIVFVVLVWQCDRFHTGFKLLEI